MPGGGVNVDDLMSKLQNVLNDEESMKQIQELAGMLSSEMQESQSQPPASPVPASGSSSSNQQDSGGPDLSQLLSKLGGMFSGGNETVKNNVPSVSPGQPASGQNQTGSFDLSVCFPVLEQTPDRAVPRTLRLSRALIWESFCSFREYWLRQINQTKT